MRRVIGRRWGFVLILPSLVGFCLFFLLPFLGSLYYTFTQGVVDPHFVGLANFTELLSTPQFLQAAKNTICFLAIGGLLLIILSLAVSVVSVKGDFVLATLGAAAADGHSSGQSLPRLECSLGG